MMTAENIMAFFDEYIEITKNQNLFESKMNQESHKINCANTFLKEILTFDIIKCYKDSILLNTKLWNKLLLVTFEKVDFEKLTELYNNSYENKISRRLKDLQNSYNSIDIENQILKKEMENFLNLKNKKNSKENLKKFISKSINKNSEEILNNSSNILGTSSCNNNIIVNNINNENVNNNSVGGNYNFSYNNFIENNSIGYGKLNTNNSGLNYISEGNFPQNKLETGKYENKILCVSNINNKNSQINLKEKSFSGNYVNTNENDCNTNTSVKIPNKDLYYENINQKINKNLNNKDNKDKQNNMCTIERNDNKRNYNLGDSPKIDRVSNKFRSIQCKESFSNEKKKKSCSKNKNLKEKEKEKENQNKNKNLKSIQKIAVYNEIKKNIIYDNSQDYDCTENDINPIQENKKISLPNPDNSDDNIILLSTNKPSHKYHKKNYNQKIKENTSNPNSPLNRDNSYDPNKTGSISNSLSVSCNNLKKPNNSKSIVQKEINRINRVIEDFSSTKFLNEFINEKNNSKEKIKIRKSTEKKNDQKNSTNKNIINNININTVSFDKNQTNLNNNLNKQKIVNGRNITMIRQKPMNKNTSVKNLNILNKNTNKTEKSKPKKIINNEKEIFSENKINKSLSNLPNFNQEYYSNPLLTTNINKNSDNVEKINFIREHFDKNKNNSFNLENIYNLHFNNNTGNFNIENNNDNISNLSNFNSSYEGNINKNNAYNNHYENINNNFMPTFKNTDNSNILSNNASFIKENN